MEEVEEVRSLQRSLADLIIQMRPLDEIRLLLAQGAHINLPVTQGLRPLHYAVYHKYTECVDLLILRGCRMDVMDDNGQTPLHYAAERGYLEILKRLIDADAQVRFTDSKSYQPLTEEPLQLAIKNEHYECAEHLLEHGADPNAIYFLESELHLTADRPCCVPFVELLLKHGANIESRDRSGRTPLMRVARKPNGYEAVKLLLQYGAQVNCYAPEQEKYRSVLHYAIMGGNLSTLRLLLFAGAPVAYPSEQLDKPAALELAILRGDHSMVRMLIDFGAQLNTGSSLIGLPLHVALSEKIAKRHEILESLLKNGANPNLITVDHRGPRLKPPIGEYLNNTKQLQASVVRMLLRYNARVICTAQVQHPLGILKCLNKLRLPLDMSDRDSPQLEQMERQPDETNREVSSDCEILNILLDAAERFSIQAIRRCSLLNATQKAYILSIAQQPRSLKQTARLALRRHVFDVADHVFEYVHRSTMDEIDCNSNFISNDSIGGGRCISRASSSDDSSGMPELEDADDSYVVNRNAYKRYVGDRYSRMTNHQMLRDLLCPHSPVEGEQHDCEQTMLARACGLTTDEMQALRARHDSALDPKMLETLDDVYALPVGYRIPPGSDWPIKLIQINQNYHEYSMRWSSPWILNCNSGYVQMFKDNDSNEQFKSSAMFALFILRQLPLPHTLTQYVLFEN